MKSGYSELWRACSCRCVFGRLDPGWRWLRKSGELENFTHILKFRDKWRGLQWKLGSLVTWAHISQSFHVVAKKRVSRSLDYIQSRWHLLAGRAEELRRLLPICVFLRRTQALLIFAVYALLALLAVIVKNSMVLWTFTSFWAVSDALLTAHDRLEVDFIRRQLWHIYLLRDTTPS